MSAPSSSSEIPLTDGMLVDNPTFPPITNHGQESSPLSSPIAQSKPTNYAMSDLALPNDFFAKPSRDIIRYCLAIVQDMNLTEQEMDQWIKQRDQEAEEEIKSILQKISAETMTVIPLESVKNETDEAKKEIDVILERHEEPQKESKEDQPLIFYMADTFVSDDHDLTDSYVLEDFWGARLDPG
ncbi:hypothetical protein Sjap_004517 [Stephania japonica]|uniref:Uncharacterized protein n=1 Tax=Stephania japonica TaxID=461633 RepID=A0AAP0K3F1_9MAGN